MKTPARLLAFLLLSGASLYADVPATINYQGAVSDSTGTLIGATGALNRKIVFRIYDASTGGNRLWTEEQTVTIYKGEFSVLLGNGTTATGTASSESHPTLDTVFTLAASTRYIEVMVDNGDGSITATDTPISPRQAITSAAYAFHAKVADGIASSTDLTITPTSGTATNYGVGWYGSGRTWNGVTVDGPVLYGNAGGALGSNVSGTKNISLLWNASGQVGIGATGSFAATNKLTLQGDDASTPASQLSIRGNTDTNERLLVGFDTTNNRSTLQSYGAASTTGPLLLNPSGGLVGVGTSSPAANLTVEGSISATGSGGHGFGTGGDTDGGLFSPADGVVTLKTNGNERLRVDEIGSVGIGTTAPSSWGKLHVSGGNVLVQSTNNPALGLRANDTTADYALVSTAGTYSTSAAVGDLVITANSGKVHLKSILADSAITIATDNKVGIGTASPTQVLDVNGMANFNGIATFANPANGNGRGIYGTVGGNDNWLIYGYAPSDDNGQMILETGDGGNEPILFRQNNVGTPYERMRISAAGRLCVGTIDESMGGNLVLGNAGLSIVGNPQRAGYAKAYATINVAGGGIQFSVHGSGNDPNWRSFSYDGDSNIDFGSDVRLKKDIVDVEPMLERMMQVQFRRFRWKDETNPDAKLQLGVIAQEVQPLFPDIVTVGTEPEAYLRVGYGDFASIACKALQEYVTSNDAEVDELRAEIQAKDARISALEAKLAEQSDSQNARLAAIEKLLSKGGQ